jgi:hypothetical protein
MGRMEIGVAYAAGFSFDQNLANSGRGNVPFPELQRFSKLLDNRSVHLEWHGKLLCILRPSEDSRLTTDP